MLLYKNSGAVLKAQSGIETKPFIQDLINTTSAKRNQPKAVPQQISVKDNVKQYSPVVGVPMTAAQKEAKRLQALRVRLGNVHPYTPQSKRSVAKDIALNPLTALGYVVRNESLPNNFTSGDRNVLDHAVDIVNPAFYLNQGEEAIDNSYKSIKHLANGEFTKAGESATSAAMNGLALIPLAAEYKAIGKLANTVSPTLKTAFAKPAVAGFEKEISFLESHIAGLNNEKNAAEAIQKNLILEYKAGNITAAEYGEKAKALNVPDMDMRIGEKAKELRQTIVKKEISGSPQLDLLQSEGQLGANISDGGSNSLGVFELGDSHVARLSKYGHDDASRLINYTERIKSPRIAKTVQVKEINGKVYQVQERASGTPITKMSEAELKSVPQEHIENFWSDKAELDQLGLSVDVSGGKSNIFYDNKKGFQFIDLGISKSPENNVITEVYKGLRAAGLQKAAVPEVAQANVAAARFNLTRSSETIDLARLKTKTPRTEPKQYSFLEDSDIGHGMVERTPNPLSKKNPGLVKEIHVAGDKTKRIQLMNGVTADGRKTYYFTASMPDNQLQAGRAFKQLEKHIPKGSLIVENKSLSNDSFYNMLKKASKTNEFQWSDEGFVPLNNQAKNKVFSNQQYAVKDTQNTEFEDFNQAKKALEELNARIIQPGIPKARLSKVVREVPNAPAEGADFTTSYLATPKGGTYKKTTFGIDIPNIGLTKLYRKGGIIYKHQFGGIFGSPLLTAFSAYNTLKNTAANPKNWGVKDYTKSGSKSAAYKAAKLAGEKEYLHSGKRYSTAYGGTPRQEVGRYGAEGKKILEKDDIDYPAQVALYPKLGRYLPGHLSATDYTNSSSVDYSSIGNMPNGLTSSDLEGASVHNVYGYDDEKFADKAFKLPNGKWFGNRTESDWNLITNNCADNVCDAFGVPRDPLVTTPPQALDKIKKKFKTVEVTGRTYEDYKEDAIKYRNKPGLGDTDKILGIVSSPEFVKSGLSRLYISTMQKKLASAGYDMSSSEMKNYSNPVLVGGHYFDQKHDGVYGKDTAAQLALYKKYGKQKLTLKRR